MRFVKVAYKYINDLHVLYSFILFILGGSAEQENVVPYYVIKFLQVIHSYVRNVGI